MLWRRLDEQTSLINLGSGPDRLHVWAAAVQMAGARGGVDVHRGRLDAALAVRSALPPTGFRWRRSPAIGSVIRPRSTMGARWPVWWPTPLPPAAQAYVVENPPLIVEAAGDWDGPPIVCSSGRPTVATVTLIRQLTAGGAIALQHADSDIAGRSITGWLSRRANTVPWRMDAADHLGPGRACAAAFDGPIPDAPWDPALREAVDSDPAAAL